MVEKRITTIEELVNILEVIIGEKNGIGGFSDDTFEIQKTNKAFLVKNKKNKRMIEIPHSNCFSIEENVKRLESELSRVGIYNINRLTTTKLFEDIEKLEKLAKEPNVRIADCSILCNDYRISIPNKCEYEIAIHTKIGKIRISRFTPPNALGSIKRDIDKLVKVGFEDDLKIAVKINHPKETLFCSYCNQPIYGEKCNCRNVNHPSHYTQGKIECIEAMEAMLTPEEFRGYLRGSIFKYQWRVMDKNGVEDLEKAKWYLDYLIKKLREVDNKK